MTTLMDTIKNFEDKISRLESKVKKLEDKKGAVQQAEPERTDQDSTKKLIQETVTIDYVNNLYRNR